MVRCHGLQQVSVWPGQVPGRQKPHLPRGMGRPLPRPRPRCAVPGLGRATLLGLRSGMPGGWQHLAGHLELT